MMTFRLCLLAACMTCPAITFADQSTNPVVTKMITLPDSAVAILLETDEPTLYYKIPERWQIADAMVSLTRITEQAAESEVEENEAYYLNFVLGPSYSSAASVIAALRRRQPEAFILPIPKSFISAEIDIPTAVGHIRKALTPRSELSLGEYFYYRLSLSEKQLRFLRKATKDHYMLNGLVIYAFPFQDSTFKQVSEVRIDLKYHQLFERTGSST